MNDLIPDDVPQDIPENLLPLIYKLERKHKMATPPPEVPWEYMRTLAGDDLKLFQNWMRALSYASAEEQKIKALANRLLTIWHSKNDPEALELLKRLAEIKANIVAEYNKAIDVFWDAMAERYGLNREQYTYMVQSDWTMHRRPKTEEDNKSPAEMLVEGLKQALERLFKGLGEENGCDGDCDNCPTNPTNTAKSRRKKKGTGHGTRGRRSEGGSR